jgi:hypothetical protein
VGAHSCNCNYRWVGDLGALPLPRALNAQRFLIRQGMIRKTWFKDGEILSPSLKPCLTSHSGLQAEGSDQERGHLRSRH